MVKSSSNVAGLVGWLTWTRLVKLLLSGVARLFPNRAHYMERCSVAEKEHRGLRRSCVCSGDNLPLTFALSEAEVEATPLCFTPDGACGRLPLLSQNMLCSNKEARGQTMAWHMLRAAVFGQQKMGLGESFKRDQDMINKAGIDRDRE